MHISTMYICACIKIKKRALKKVLLPVKLMLEL